jgi:hypothetical protein
MASREKLASIAKNRRDVREGRLQKPNTTFSHVDEIEVDKKASTATTTNGPAVASKPKPSKNLADPKEQFRILQGGDALGYTLALDEGDVEIEVRTTFTIADELHRRVMENLEAFRTLLGIEMSAYNPAHRPGDQPDWVWIATHTEYLDAAMRVSHVRQRAREIVSRLSRFVVADPDPKNPPPRVTPAHLEEGMAQTQLGAAIMFLLKNAQETLEARADALKKARAAKAAPG